MRSLVLAIASSLLIACVRTSPEALAFVPFDTHPDLFLEVSSTQEGWGTTTGWVHWHWLGEWEASGEARVTTVEVISTFADVELRLPPVMEEQRLRVSDEGIEILRKRSITAEMPDEITEMPAGSYLLKWPLEAGNTWTTEERRFRTWSRITSLEAASPNTLATRNPCVVVMSVAAEHRPSDAVILDVVETWWAPGIGPVMIEQAHGPQFDLDWGALPPESLAALVSRRDAMAQHATMRLMPPYGADR